MDNFITALSQEELQVWLLSIGAFYAASYLIIWMLAVVLSRIPMLGKSRPSVSVYLGWAIPLSLHTILCACIVVWAAKYYRDQDVPLGYCAVFFAPMFISGMLAIKAIRKFQERLNIAETMELKTK